MLTFTITFEVVVGADVGAADCVWVGEVVGNGVGLPGL
jgi:hypothetical protein